MPFNANQPRTVPAMSATTRSKPSAKMNRLTPRPAFMPVHEDIALCALGIWEAEGRPEGRDREHWLLAESLLTDHPTVTAGSLMGGQPRRVKLGSQE